MFNRTPLQRAGKTGATGPSSASNFNSLFLLQDVSVNYGNLQALSNIQFQVDQGEIVFVTGVSGAGKTTLLKLLAGEIEPTQGLVMDPASMGKRSVFFSRIFQDLRLVEKQTCEQNLMTSYDRTVYESKNEFMTDMMELARIIGIKDRLNLKIKDANGGLKQKVAFLRSILSRPDIILADEPTSSLDYENARKMFDILNLYNSKRGLTVVWASHNSELIKKFTGRIVHLDKGRLIYSGHACFI